MTARYIALARVTLECTAPLTVGTGGGDDVNDSICVTDANGRPSIPGSSIAGVLRHGMAGGPDGEHAERLFGFQKSSEGRRSLVRVSWAQVHGPRNQPLAMGVDDNTSWEREDAPLLGLLERGVLRDHVRIGHRGVAEARGKFDERLVPRGTRFTFELRVDGGGEGDPGKDLDVLLGALKGASFRIGGRTRRGYGTVAVVRVLARTFDLTKDHADWARLPRALHETVPQGVLVERKVESIIGTDAPDFVSATLALAAEDYWLFGGGEPVREGHFRTNEKEGGGKKPLNMVPKTEPMIVWKSDKGTTRATVGLDSASLPNLVPASSVKGALRHRTEFHLRAAQGVWADGGAKDDEAEEGVQDALSSLFGRATDDNTGTPGRVFLSDAYLLPSTQGLRDGALDHVSIDRFTGGPMDGMLFSEAPLHGGTVAMSLVVHAREDIAPHVRAAFGRAVTDLLHGKLGLGAGNNRGHGFFRGELRDDHKLQAWLGVER